MGLYTCPCCNVLCSSWQMQTWQQSITVLHADLHSQPVQTHWRGNIPRRIPGLIYWEPYRVKEVLVVVKVEKEGPYNIKTNTERQISPVRYHHWPMIPTEIWTGPAKGRAQECSVILVLVWNTILSTTEKFTYISRRIWIFVCFL